MTSDKIYTTWGSLLNFVRFPRVQVYRGGESGRKYSRRALAVRQIQRGKRRKG